MTDWTDDTLRDLAPAYALGTLAPDEATRFEAALAARPWLAAEVASHRAVLDRLATAERVAPPPALRERVLARIAAEAGASSPATRGVPPTLASGDPSRDAATVPGRPIGHGPTRATPAATRARARWLVPSLLGAALAASLLVIVSQRAALRTTETRLAQRDSALAALATTLAARETTLATLLDAEREVLVVRLTSGADAAPGVQFFWNVRARRGVLRAYGLAPAPAGKAYQLWLIERGTPVPMPVFNTDAQGRAVLAGLEMPASTDGAEAIAITLEPDGGSRTPSSRPVLIGSLARGE